MQKFIEIFKNIKIVDWIIILCVIIGLFVGAFTTKNFRQTADKQIEATSQISFQIYIRGISFTGEELPLRAKEKTFISIRNVPYSDLDIVEVKADRKKVVLPLLKTDQIMIVDDASQPNSYDVLVTLTDTAKITKDGAVVGGNKIKMGLPITLEGKDYKYTGTVTDLRVMHLTNDEELNKTINKADNVQ
ncbi:MAG: DUF4330 domain-containing protein [Candidatus Gastranaerophilales bacterium]